jgi:hypothetical protein
VVLEKQTDAEIAQRLQQKDRDYTNVEKIGELFDRIEQADMGARLEPITKDAEPAADGRITIDGIELALNGESNGVVYADLKNKLGMDTFKRVMRMAEANEGRYLKTLKSIQFPNAAARNNFLEALRNPPPAPEQPSAPSGVTFKTGETKHAKTGDDLFVATPDQRVERDVYDQMASAAKALGGWYSSFKGRGAIPGFQFKSAEARKSFLDQMGGGLGEAPRRSDGMPASFPDKPRGTVGQRVCTAPRSPNRQRAHGCLRRRRPGNRPQRRHQAVCFLLPRVPEGAEQPGQRYCGAPQPPVRHQPQ